MTRTQAQILESIAALPEAERRALVEHLVATHLDGTSFLSRMTAGERARLDEAIAQADRGDLHPSSAVWNRLTNRLYS